MKPKNSPALTSSLPPSLRLNLCPNHDPAPGAPDKPRPRKTPTEAAAIRDEKARTKKEQVKKHDEGIQKAAVLEDLMQKEDEDASCNVNHPPRGQTTKSTRLPIPQGSPGFDKPGTLSLSCINTDGN